jgi:hypothetical protein
MYYSKKADFFCIIEHKIITRDVLLKFVDYQNCKTSENISYFSNFGSPTVVIADMRA